MAAGFALAGAWLPPRSRRTLRPRAGACRGKRRRVGVCARGARAAASGGGDGGAPEKPAADAAGVPEGERNSRAFVEYLREASAAESALANPSGTIPSHKLVTFDGLEPQRFVYVEERDCIGCTHCATTARGTFFMEEENGRARVFSQTGDSERVVEEAIDTCPVDCIYYTTFEDLCILETEREAQKINNMARLVGGQDLTSSLNVSTAEINNSGIMRCTSCPRSSFTHPFVLVGDNPVFKKRQEDRAAKRRSEGKGTLGGGSGGTLL